MTPLFLLVDQRDGTVVEFTTIWNLAVDLARNLRKRGYDIVIETR